MRPILLLHQNYDGSLPYLHECLEKCVLFPLLHVLTAERAHPEGTLGANAGQDPFSWQTCSPMSKGCAFSLLPARAWVSEPFSLAPIFL